MHMQESLFDLQAHSSVPNMRLFNSPCQPGIHLPRKMKVEPDLSLVQDELLVRYECSQSLEIHVT